MDFYPEGLPVPAELGTSDLVLKMLTPEVVELDYDAFMSSRPRLRQWSDGNWPADDFTLEDNREDLARHEREFRDREAFAYTVLNQDESRCEGCIYINSLQHSIDRHGLTGGPDMPTVAPTDAVVTYWVRESVLERDLDRQLLAGLVPWLASEWRFRAVYFMTNEWQARDEQHIAEAGLKRAARLKSPRPDGPTWTLSKIPPMNVT